MDARGRCHDNIFIGRLWRARRDQLRCALKYELIYLMAFENGKHLNKEVGQWIDWSNQERSHQALNYRTPEIVYWEKRIDQKEA